MKRSLLLGLVLLAACRPPDDTHEGIAVGNPGLVSMALATSSGFSLTRAELPIDWVGYASCGGSDRLASVDRTDLVVPATAAIPQGSWCGFVVALSGAATLEADWSEGVASGTLQPRALKQHRAGQHQHRHRALHDADIDRRGAERGHQLDLRQGTRSSLACNVQDGVDQADARLVLQCWPVRGASIPKAPNPGEPIGGDCGEGCRGT